MEGRMGPILMVGKKIMRRTERLDKAVYPIRCKLRRGIESEKGKNVWVLTWKCPKCGKVNRPERRLLVVLPVIVCSCGEESNVQFDFSLHKIELNGHFLIPVIRKQEPKECSPSSMLSLAEISWRVNAILSGQALKDNEPYLDRADMLQKYDYLCDVCGIEKRFNQTAVETLLDVFSTIGVSAVCKEEDKDGSVNEVRFKSEASNPKEAMPNLYRLPFYSAVKKKFSGICRLLGDGYAIRTSFYAGKNFGKLKPGKIYKSPGRGRIRHAIVLIGAGRRGKTNYYHFLNSWGKQFCLRILKRGIRVGRARFLSSRRVRNTEKALGGFGLLRASDIVARPITFLRHEDDRKYYESLLLEDIVPPRKAKEGPEAASITPSWEVPQPANTCSTNSELSKSEGTSLINSQDQVLVSTEPSGQSTQVVDAILSPTDEASADCCGGYFAGQSSAPPPPNDMTVRQVADKLASFVAKNGRQFENITRQRNPGDTPFKFLFDKHCSDYKYYEFELAEEERALAQSKEAEASKSDNSGVASFKTPGDHMAPLSEPEALMEFYAKKAAQEERKRPPRQSEDEMPPSPLQGPAKKGHHMGDFIPSEELEKFMALCNDTAAQKATKEAGKAKIQADNTGHKLLRWVKREGSLLKERNEHERER